MPEVYTYFTKFVSVKKSTIYLWDFCFADWRIYYQHA